MGELPRVLGRRGVEVNEESFLYPIEDDERNGSHGEKEGHARRVGQTDGEDDSDLGVPVRDLAHEGEEEESNIGRDGGTKGIRQGVLSVSPRPLGSVRDKLHRFGARRIPDVW